MLSFSPQPQLLPFERGEMLNPYALSILEIIEPFFQKSYRCFAEFPLQLACSKEEGIHLPIELWRFWVNSRLDSDTFDSRQSLDNGLIVHNFQLLKGGQSLDRMMCQVFKVSNFGTRNTHTAEDFIWRVEDIFCRRKLSVRVKLEKPLVDDFSYLGRKLLVEN